MGTNREDAALLRQVRLVLLLAVGLLLGGTLGYMALDQLSVLDALYMTVITVGTVGYREVAPTTPISEVFTIILIMVGVGGIAYTGATIVQYVVEGRVGGALYRRRVRRMVEQLTNHVILCGYGRVGQAVAHELRGQGTPFVLLDSRADRVEQAGHDGYLALCGDAAQDAVLEAAGIARARSLVSAVDSDADNLYITLSARVLAPALYIVARASDNSAAAKLRRGGANRVLSPYTVAGHQLALLAVRSTVADFVSNVVSWGEPLDRAPQPRSAARLESLTVTERGRLAGRTPDEAQAQLAPGGKLLAVSQAGGQLLTDWADGQLRLQPGDQVILLGTAAQLAAAAQLA